MTKRDFFAIDLWLLFRAFRWVNFRRCNQKTRKEQARFCHFPGTRELAIFLTMKFVSLILTMQIRLPSNSSHKINKIRNIELACQLHWHQPNNQPKSLYEKPIQLHSLISPGSIINSVVLCAWHSSADSRIADNLRRNSAGYWLNLLSIEASINSKTVLLWTEAFRMKLALFSQAHSWIIVKKSS